MTKLLEQALEAARQLSPEDQDELARSIFEWVGMGPLEPVKLTEEERQAIAESRAAAARGEFATEEEVRAIFARYGA